MIETAPYVEVVIAVHTPTRPIRRAVDSVLAASPSGRSRAIVVAHGIAAADIEVQLEGRLGARVRVEEFHDGIRSPAGPFNHGLAAATGPFVAVMGSDDTLEDGAIDAALARAQNDRADAVILPLRHAGGAAIRTPLPRWRRKRRLDPVRDRMFTRTAPLAVLRRDLVAAFAPVFDPAFATGEDLEFGARLWTEASASYHPSDPAYVIGADADDRVTSATTDLEIVLAAPAALASRPWVEAAAPAVRRSLAVKVLRVSVLGGMERRVTDPAPLAPGERIILAQTVTAWLRVAPAAFAPFSRADRAVLDAVRRADEPGLRAAVAARSAAGRFARLVPRNPLRVFDRESTLRRYVLYALPTPRRDAA